MNISSDTPLTLLARAEAMYEEARRIRFAAIVAARSEELSWNAIGDALGMSNVAARRLFLRNVATPPDTQYPEPRRTAQGVPAGSSRSSHERTLA